jgi:hypothetical protein
MSSEWDQRQLCPDGGCLGVIGPDGACKVCGRAMPGWGEERARGTRSPEDVAEAERQDEARVDRDDATAGDDFDDRELCPDGACVGVIGDDGRCKRCRTPRAAP